ncbi:MAG TPA: hypothetical protein PLW78_12135 [bacterium]|nr:hypothetical protein [bacterium]
MDNTTKTYLTYEEIKKELCQCSFKLEGSYYHQEREKHSDWPEWPREHYSDSWESWDIFVGCNNKNNFINSYKDLRDQVISAKIRSVAEYVSACRNHPDWPFDPEICFYGSWCGWHHFFDTYSVFRTKEMLSYKKLKQQILKCHMTCIQDYYDELPKHSDWPKNPEFYYAGVWISWDKFLAVNYNRNFYNFQDLLLFLKEKGIRTMNEYYELCMKKRFYPLNPEKLYKEWPGEEKFLSMIQTAEEPYNNPLSENMGEDCYMYYILDCYTA